MMTLSFNILGFEIATLKLDLPEGDNAPKTVIDNAIKAGSRWWIGRVFR